MCKHCYPLVKHPCRLCGSTREPTRHHLIPQRLATRVGDGFVGFDPADVRHPSNIVRLCRVHHDAVELGVYLSLLRSRLRTQEVIHVERVAGRDWLDTHYPPEEQHGHHTEG